MRDIEPIGGGVDRGPAYITEATRLRCLRSNLQQKIRHERELPGRSDAMESKTLITMSDLVQVFKQYPNLVPQIQDRMRREIFNQRVISPNAFEQEVQQKASISQPREVVPKPAVEESSDARKKRVMQIRDDLTCIYFVHNIPRERFEEIIQEELKQQVLDREATLSFNPEQAPLSQLLATGQEYESYLPIKKAQVQHHLQQIVAVLVKGILSEQLDFVSLARELFTVADLKWIHDRCIGQGQVGGKTAGILLAWKILQRAATKIGFDSVPNVDFPASYIIGADVFYEFLDRNRLFDYIGQKYKERDEIEANYPKIREAYIHGKFPDYVLECLRKVLEQVGEAPLIVRSSSLLEANFGFAFSGKYDSFFLPNQRTPEENLQALTRAISELYASVANPDALLYRKHIGGDLVDYDEQMAVLIQEVVGARYRDYFFPTLAGVAISRNFFRWSPRFLREKGLVRLVLGLGTRAVSRTSSDYPRMIALSHPTLRPQMGAKAIAKYAQQSVDVLNLESNALETLAVSQLIAADFPYLKLLASVIKGDDIQPIRFLTDDPDPNSLVVTFDNLLAETDFVAQVKFLLETIEGYYRCPVEIEFAVQIDGSDSPPELRLTLLQCRPFRTGESGQPLQVPDSVPEADKIFTGNYLVPHGIVSDVRYIVWIDPRTYDQIADLTTKLQLARVVGHVNKRLEGQRFILMGPCRWGSTNPNLGVKVTFTDIHNARALIEVAVARGNQTPEVSVGTHFFQDLVEARIYPLPLYPDNPDNLFNWHFFDKSPNVLTELEPDLDKYAAYVKLIDVPAVANGCHLEIVMHGGENKALGYLKQ
jgi:hypothetical protein